MKKTSNDFLDEAHRNAKSDRRRLEDLYEDIASLFNKEDKEASIMIAEPLTKLSDCLTKNNVQLIEIAKTKLKSENNSVHSKLDDFSDDETEMLYDELENDADLN